MKAKRGKCLALVAVLAMVVCAFAVALPAGDSDAAADGTKSIGTTPELIEAGAADAKTTGSYYVTGDVTLNDSQSATGVIIYLVGSGSVTTGSSVSNVTLRLAVANGDDEPEYYYDGLEFSLSVASKKYTAVPADSTTGTDAGIKTTESGANTPSAYGVILTGETDNNTYYPEGADVYADLLNTHVVEVIDGGIVTINGYDSGTSKAVNTIVLKNVRSDSGSSPVIVTCGATQKLTYAGTIANDTSSDGYAQVEVTKGKVAMSSTPSSSDTAKAYYTMVWRSSYAYAEFADALASGALSGKTVIYGMDVTDDFTANDGVQLFIKEGQSGSYSGTVTYTYDDGDSNTTNSTVKMDITAEAISGAVLATSTSTMTLAGQATTLSDGTYNYLAASTTTLNSISNSGVTVTTTLNGVALATQDLSVELTAGTNGIIVPKDSTITFKKGGSIGMTDSASSYVTVLGALKYDTKTVTSVSGLIDNGTNALVHTNNINMVKPYATNPANVKSVAAVTVDSEEDFMMAVENGQDMVLAKNVKIVDTIDLSNVTIDLNGKILAIGNYDISELTASDWIVIGDDDADKGSLSLTDVIVYADEGAEDDGTVKLYVAEGGSLSITDSKVFAVVDVNAKATIDVDNAGVVYDGTSSDVKVGYGTVLELSGKITTNIDVYGDLVISSTVSIGASNYMNVYSGATVTIDGELDVAGEVTLFDGAELTVNGYVEVANANGGATFTVDGAEVLIAEGASFVVKASNSGIAAENVLDIDNDAPAYDKDDKSWNARFVVEGSLEIKGTLSGPVYDAGTVAFNGKSDSGAVYLADGISFTADSVTGTLTVSDLGAAMVYDRNTENDYNNDGEVDDLAADGNTVTIKDAKGVTVSTAVTSDTWKDKKTNKSVTGYYSTMEVSGTVTAVSTDAVVTLNASSDYFTKTDEKGYSDYTGISVNEDIVLGKETTLNFNSGSIYVNGTVTAIVGQTTSAGTTVDGSELVFGASAYVYVYGHITVLQGNQTGTPASAVEYTVTVTGTEAAEYVHWTSFDEALGSVDDADDSELTIIGYVTAYVSAEIPAGVTIAMDNGATFAVYKGVTITLKEGAEIDGSKATISVKGTFVAENAADDLTIKTVSADVVIEDLPMKTWTTLSNAIDSGMTDIVLNQKVKITSDLEIPEGVTVTTNYKVDGDYAFTVSDCKLTVNGTLAFGEKTDGTLYVTGDNGEVVVNGTLAMRVVDLDDSGKEAMADIYGAYFVIEEGAYSIYYVTNVANAAEITAGSTKVQENTVYIKGVVACGDVDFVGADDILTIQMDTVTVDGTPTSVFVAGTIGLTGAELVNDAGTFTGSVETVDALFSFVAAEDFYVEDGADGTTIGAELSGAMVMEGGEAVIGVYDGDTVFTVTADGMFTVADGAELTIPYASTGNYTFAVEENEDVVTTEIAGTIIFEQGADLAAAGELLVSGTMEVSNMTLTGDDIVRVTGSLNVADGKTLTLYGATLILGAKITDLGATGTVSGTVYIVPSTESAILAYAGASMDADVNINAATGLSEAVYTTYYINGIEYATIYTTANNVNMPISVIYGLDGDIDLFKYDTPEVADQTWYATQDYNAKLDESVEGYYVGDYAKVYRIFASKTISGTISKDAGIILTIDDVIVNRNGGSGDASQSFSKELSVGTHKVAWSERSGYSIDNVKVTFNGQEVKNGGTITITADMQGYSLIVSGSEPYVAPVVEDKDTGMKVTDYLLIVLVVLIAIMAIMVALRLMRS